MTVTLLTAAATGAPTTTTDENGNYYFGGLPAGTVHGGGDAAGGLTQTYDADRPPRRNQCTVTIGGANPLINLDQDFGYRARARIGDLVWRTT